MEGTPTTPDDPSSKLEADLQKSAARIIAHMNNDHPDSLKAYAVFYAGLNDAASASMSALSVHGFVLDVVLTDGTTKKNVLIRYSSPLESAASVRKVAVAMHFAAYNGLGTMYKIRHNFYGNAVVQAWTHMPTKVKYPLAGVLVGVVGIVFKTVQVLRRRMLAY